MTRIDVALPAGAATGWAPILRLAEIAAQLFGGNVVRYPDEYPRRLRKAWGLRPRPAGDQDAVLLALLYGPSFITHLREGHAFRGNYRHVVAWIIDSFWEDRNVRRVDFNGIDLVCIIRADETEFYRRQLGDRILPLNWGSDVLRLGCDNADRPVDVQRVGRQPEVWNDDLQSEKIAATMGLRFAGRPPNHPDPMTNQHVVMQAYSHAKFLVAHSNLVSAANYTHPTKEYITARWTDALASGCSLAGVQPRSDGTYRNLFWPGAALDFDRVDLRHNMAAVAEAVAAWTPQHARHNHLMALQRLDWRHALKRIATAISVSSDALDGELSEIARRATGLAGPAGR